ncbi:MAG: hypothetical protein J7M25_07200 [Deltaproteobacteria bacterium]|nr:hypothetical protein [Deltaproteobacteria bacterium]
MRRIFVQIFGLALLLEGPIYPYLHLATVPHRYCQVHHTFERIHPHKGPLGNSDDKDTPDDDHEQCWLAALVCSSIDRPTNQAQVTVLTQVGTIQPEFVCNPAASRNLLLRQAPKGSPPPSFL